MRVFITGATGYIGLAVALAFRRAGHEVTGLVRSEKSARLLRQQEITPLIGDISSPETFLLHAEKAEVLIHCAFEMSAESCAKDLQLIDQFLLLGKKSTSLKTFVYTSGVWVYGDTQGHTIDETSPLNPLDIVKWRPLHEDKVLEASSTHFHTLVMRPGCVYGGTGGLPSLWFKAASEKGAIPIVGEGHNHWAMIHRDDLAQGYLLAVEKELNNVVLNFSDGSHPTVREMTEAVCKTAKAQIHSLSYGEALQEFGATAEGLAVDQKISSQRAERLLNWHPRHTNFIDEVELYFRTWKASL